MNVWAYIIVLIISAIISVALAPKPKQPKPASLEDFDIPVAEEGKEIPVVFGTVDIKDSNVLWYGDLQVEPIRKSGGKK